MIAVLAIALAAEIGFLAPDDGGVWQLWVAGAPGSATQVTRGEADLVWLSEAAEDGSFVVTRADGIAILFDADLAELESIEIGRGSDQAALSPDGRLIAYTRTLGSGDRQGRDLWLYDRDLAQSRPFIARSGLQQSPAWSRDGASLLFTEGRPGADHALWIRRLDGAHEEQLTVGNHFDFEPAVAANDTIYFSSNREGDYDIYRRIDGTRIEKVIDSDAYDGAPRVSPDGKRIVFISARGGRPEIWTAAADGAGATPWPMAAETARAPMWLRKAGPEPGWIAHMRVGEDGRWQPWTMRTDGSGERPIAVLDKDASRLSVTADGSRLLACASDGTLYVVDIASGSVDEIEIEPGGSTDAAISPDGRRVAFSVSTLGGIDTNDIWIVPVTGGMGRKLTEQNYMQHFPTWTEDGDLVYLSGRGGQVHDVWRVSSSGGKPVEVLADHRYNFEPTVSASDDVAFSSNVTGDYEIFLLESGAAGPQLIVEHPHYDGQPYFSPSGEQIVFNSRRDGAGRLWIADISSKAVWPLTTEGEARMPVWYGDGPTSDEITENRK